VKTPHGGAGRAGAGRLAALQLLRELTMETTVEAA